jgi:hypothetical protein
MKKPMRMKIPKRNKIPSFPFFLEMKDRMTKELEKNFSEREFSNTAIFSYSVNISGVLGKYIRKFIDKYIENIFELIW